MASLDFIIYNDVCEGDVKPVIHPVGPDGELVISGPAVKRLDINTDRTFESVRLKYDSNFDITAGGETTLDGVELLAGDRVYLSNQDVPAENGIYFVSTGSWTFDIVVDEDVFVDLGARAYDEVDGDITRNIIVDNLGLDFGTVGVYTVTYSVINSAGVLATTFCKIRIFDDGASLMPTNSFGITHYEICSDIDTDILS